MSRGFAMLENGDSDDSGPLASTCGEEATRGLLLWWSPRSLSTENSPLKGG